MLNTSLNSGLCNLIEKIQSKYTNTLFSRCHFDSCVSYNSKPYSINLNSLHYHQLLITLSTASRWSMFSAKRARRNLLARTIKRLEEALVRKCDINLNNITNSFFYNGEATLWNSLLEQVVNVKFLPKYSQFNIANYFLWKSSHSTRW